MVVSAGLVSLWDGRTAVGVVAGGGWNIASLWCLTRLLSAWLGPERSRRRVLRWLLVKFPLLYALAILGLRTPGFSIVGFGIGFTVVLLVVVGRFALWSRRPVGTHPYGR